MAGAGVDSAPGLHVVQRIVSVGQVSPPGFWYDQDEHEWVMLLLGSAQLEFEDGARVELEAGDSLLIPAHRLHRVSRTSVEPVAVWLAVFCAAAD